MDEGKKDITYYLKPYMPTQTWHSYRESAELYFEANQVQNEDIKKAILITMVGAETYKIIKSLFAPTSPKDINIKYTAIITQLNAHFNPIPNEIEQRFNFNKRYQRKDESVAGFVSELRKLSEHCNYLELDNILRDRIVCGVVDKSLQKQLLAEPNLDYQRAIELATAAEVVKNNVQDIQISKQSKTVQNLDKETERCHRFSGMRSAQSCSYINATCTLCKKVGHLASSCSIGKSTKVNHKPLADTTAKPNKVFKSKRLLTATMGQFKTVVEAKKDKKFIVERFTATPESLNILKVAMSDVATVIYDNVIREPKHSRVFAEFCKKVADCNIVDFKKAIITKCQREFYENCENTLNENVLKPRDEILTDFKDPIRRKDLELNEEQKMYSKSIATTQFVGELFLVDILTYKIITWCVYTLLKAQSEMQLECLCTLLSTVGKKLEATDSTTKLNDFIQKIQVIVQNKAISEKTRWVHFTK